MGRFLYQPVMIARFVFGMPYLEQLFERSLVTRARSILLRSVPTGRCLHQEATTAKLRSGTCNQVNCWRRSKTFSCETAELQFYESPARKKSFSAVLCWTHHSIVFSIRRKRSHRLQTMFAVARLFCSFNTTKFFSLRLSLRWATRGPRPRFSYP